MGGAWTERGGVSQNVYERAGGSNQTPTMLLPQSRDDKHVPGYVAE